MLNSVLAWIIFYPILSGCVSFFLPSRLGRLTEAHCIIVSVLSLAASVFIFFNQTLYLPCGPSAMFGADKLSAFVGLWIPFFTVIISFYSSGFFQEKRCGYFGSILIAMGSSSGAVFSSNYIPLLVFWGLLALVLYFLVNMKSSYASARSAKKALIMIGGTDALMMLGICLLWTITKTFAITVSRVQFLDVASYAAYFLIFSASLAKAGAVPFHSWLPDVAEDASVPVTAYLPASLDKLLGIYLLARISLDVFAMNGVTNFMLLFTGGVTIVLAVMLALVQHDMKRLLGYHAVSQVGYMVMGIGTGNPIGIAGGLFHMLNHAIYKSCLFLCGGNVEKKAGTTDLSKLGALAPFMPLTFTAFAVAALSISGIPPFNGFVSKWMIYQGIIESAGPKNPGWAVWLVCAMFGSALTIASFMKLAHAVFLGRPEKGRARVKEAVISMSLPGLILAVLCFVFGVFAFLIPIPMLIRPCVNGQIMYLGIWRPVAATMLLFLGIVLGLIFYAVPGIKKTRRVAAFIGGEDTGLLERISGVDFYNTVSDMDGVNSLLYRKDAPGELDIYNFGRKCVGGITIFFQYLHNGRLPTYIVWCLLGMIGMSIVVYMR